WRQKEAKVSLGLPISWGEMKQRGLMWEEQTAISLLAAGSDILVLRHPANVGLVKATIDNLMGK
ncbi:MAG: acetyl-CoA decarbonylase/synthase complex subunit delta, partial [Chloroflexi bacterium]|nr:acetyl-CoA decarbonylase/synthase complex subunit delta [Chloroflexota bacterium]